MEYTKGEYRIKTQKINEYTIKIQSLHSQKDDKAKNVIGQKAKNKFLQMAYLILANYQLPEAVY